MMRLSNRTMLDDTEFFYILSSTVPMYEIYLVLLLVGIQFYDTGYVGGDNFSEVLFLIFGDYH